MTRPRHGRRGLQPASWSRAAPKDQAVDLLLATVLVVGHLVTGPPSQARRQKGETPATSPPRPVAHLGNFGEQLWGLSLGRRRLGKTELDVATVRSGDRRLTRWISHWAWSQTIPAGRPRYAGLRYLSRINRDWECWAVFDRAGLREVHRESILRNNAALRAVAKHFNLVVH